MNLSTPIEKIPRVGPQSQKKLKKLGVKNIRDLFFHFPHRYEDFSNLIPVSSAADQAGKIICLQGKIADIKNVRIFRRRMTITEAQVEDSTGKIKVTWFNQPYLINTFKPGDFVFLAGKMTVKNGKKYLSSPSYEKIPAFAGNFDSTHIGRLIPIYPETEGMSSRWLRSIIKPILTELTKQLPAGRQEINETLPWEILKEYDLLPVKEAISEIHFPGSLKLAEKAKKRFIFEELFNLSLLALREKMNLAKKKAESVNLNLDEIKKFVGLLPFELTDDQKKASWQILKDMEKPRPMNRLLNGDVGSGKTIVAAIAALNATKAGFQTALMAPTEILAKQHYYTFKNLFNPKDQSENISENNKEIKVGLITGKENYAAINSEETAKIKRKELVEMVKKGEIDILIGTHALIQPSVVIGKGVEFKNLGLVIIDEQHRFGIEQRMKLTRKQNFIPHLLSMSATPIPRTLALTAYGDLDLSLIKQLPKGRKKIITEIISPEKRKNAYVFMRKEIKSGRQAFVICPRIEPPKNDLDNEGTEILDQRILSWQDVKAVKQEYEKLKKIIFPDLNISMLHGKMKTEEKEKIMKDFEEGKSDILVSTSVIEVGVDFPNATIMAIEGADRFGLAQLHQFRGRVGRGKDQSYCFLFTDFVRNPRLRAIVKSQDGFELAEKDLKLRGPGDLTGQRQWGFPDFIMASLTNAELLEKTRSAAKETLQKDPELKKYPFLRMKLKEFQQRIHLE